MKFITHFFLLFIVSSSVYSQTKTYQINGTIADLENHAPLEFSTITLLQQSDSSYIDGAVTNESGHFIILGPIEGSMLRVSYFGYKDLFFSDFSSAKIESNTAHLDTIFLGNENAILETVEVRGEQSETIFKLDKRVFNVGKDLSNSGGSAVDVLNNVPSIEVTLEGGIRLRGNSGVQVLINGKPSVLTSDENNALGTIPADMIESVEVITNPSAKYDAEGTTGVINIILKEETKQGFNGSVTLNIGYPNNHSLGFSGNYRSKKVNFFGQVGVGTRRFVSVDTTINSTTYTDYTSTLSSYGTGEKNEDFINVRIGSDFYINDYNTMSLSGHYAYEFEKEYADLEYLLLNNSDVTSNFSRNETTSANNPKYQYDFHYQKKFKHGKDQVLDFNAVGSFFGKDKTSLFSSELITGDNIGVNQNSINNMKNSNYTYKLDYTHPFNKKWGWEIGGKYEINSNENYSEVYSQNDNVWEFDSLLSGDYGYTLGVLASYTTLAYEGKKFGIKSGLRFEQTNALATESGSSIGQWNYYNFFPSIHSSYKASKTLSFQIGYSKRISRPNMFELSPYVRFRDNYNLQTGNAALQPEFSDVIELTAIKNWKKVSFNVAVFQNYTYDVIESIITVQDNLTITSPINVGTSNNKGLEINSKYNLFKWMSMMLDGNLTYYVRQGEYEGTSFDFSSYRWSTKGTFKFKLPADIEIQSSVRYQSSIKYAFTEELGYAYMDAGIRKKFFKGKLIANFSARDVFNSRINRTSVSRSDYTYYTRSQRGRYFVLGISYNFGKGDAMEYSGFKMR